MSKLYLVLLTCAVIASPASAAIVSFTWNSVIDDIPPAVPIPGISFGDAVTVRVLADNGGSSLNSQEWYVDDIIAVHLRAGTYNAIYTSNFIPAGIQSIFQTDATGSLTAVRFSGTGETTVVDNFGTGTARLYSNQVRDTEGRFSYFVDRLLGPNPLDMVGWDQTPDIVPEPSTAIMLLSLVVFGLRRGRSQ
jgi:hypothetical protein